MNTIQEAKQHLRDNFHKGVACPCCGQFVKLYRRTLYDRMAFGLIRLYGLSGGIPGKPFHVREIYNDEHPGDFAKLAYWDLIEEQIRPGTNKKSSGEWVLTEQGRAFVEGGTVSKAVYIYNNLLYRTDPEQIKIKQALGEKYDYAELMNSI